MDRRATTGAGATVLLRWPAAGWSSAAPVFPRPGPNVPAGRHRRLPPVVVVQGDLPGLVEGVGLGHLEGPSFRRRQGRLARFRLCRLGLFESVSLRDLGVSRHTNAKSTPGDRISSGAAATAGTILAGRTTVPPRGALTRQRKRHNHPQYGWAP